VQQPDFGTLFDDMIFEGSDVRVPTGRLLQPRVEGEIAFIPAEDITQCDLPVERLQEVAGFAAPAFEIVDSAIEAWKITVADTIADNASCGAVVLGPDRILVADRDWRKATMSVTEEGAVVSCGPGAATMGDPLSAFRWLAEKAIELGEPLRRGEIVLTGALGPIVPFVPGRRYRLDIAGFAQLTALADDGRLAPSR
jgi:2-keto-4-pentenoate hydratase